RRRHTRSKRDWSSDVCSSDLRDLYGVFLIRLINHYFYIFLFHYVFCFLPLESFRQNPKISDLVNFRYIQSIHWVSLFSSFLLHLLPFSLSCYTQVKHYKFIEKRCTYVLSSRRS